MRQLVVTCVLMCALDAAAYGQSLANVAKQEEERRKTVSKTGRVYTNQDLPETSPAAPPQAASPAVTAKPEVAASMKEPGKSEAADEAKQPEKTVNEHRDEKQWRERAQTYRTRLAKLRNDVANAEGRLETLRAAQQTPVVLSEIQMTDKDLRKFQSHLQAIETEWAQVEDKAREAGATAWIQ